MKEVQFDFALLHLTDGLSSYENIQKHSTYHFQLTILKIWKGIVGKHCRGIPLCFVKMGKIKEGDILMSIDKYETLNQERKIQHTKRKVAAYCRVSTDNEDQANSFESQQRYFRQYIEHNPDWELYEVFADV